ncbi:uncharacterized protein LOC119602422 [Lucilia sericata]|uniref:uncharacterized protein LOC119602422 n=1 Tax=Lucilia sericata TaxID=13632 RepID=UPI0018A82064|nr:uncharacterized protein LOC119602422 [Lucilia sericata]
MFTTFKEKLNNEITVVNSEVQCIKNPAAVVFADQKHNAKKKLSFNKLSKKKTGGGPYEKLLLSPAEEQIVQSAGIEAAVEGVSTIKSFGTPKCASETIPNEEQSLRALLENDDSIEVDDEKCVEKSEYSQESEDKENQPSRIKKGNSKSETKLNLLISNLSNAEKYHFDLSSKLDHLIKLKEKSLKIKEEEHSANMAIKNLDIQIKTIKLELLKKKQ